MKDIALPETGQASTGGVRATGRWHIIVIGAGIGGLTGALSLQRHGFRVSVYERAAKLGDFGAGLVVTPNAMHALDFLGVGESIAESSNASTEHEYRHYKTAKVLQRRSLADVYSRYGAGVFQVHRADLHGALSAAVLTNDPGCIHPNHVFADLSQDHSRVVARFANGNVAKGDALIGCDGGRSTVREKTHGSEPVIYTGQVAFRAVVPAARLSNDSRLQARCMYVGPDRLFLHYALRNDSLMNMIAIARQCEWQEEGWTTRAAISELSTLYHDFHPKVLNIIETIEPDALFKWGLHDRQPLPQWTVGRVSMLGDAAHPMSPFLGQGASMAIEDGAILGRCFAEACSTDEALMLYESARKKRANAAQFQSRERAKALQGTFVDNFDAARNAEDIGMFDNLFAYNPATVALKPGAMLAVGEQTQ